MDETLPQIPRQHVIRESGHRIHDPLSEEKLAVLGRALRLEPGATALDLACGSGEMLCTWARDHALRGVGVDLSPEFVASARARADELGVADRVEFRHGDAAGFVADEPVDVASCLGATWIGDGLEGTLELLARSLRPGGLLLVGEPYWRTEPTAEVVRACFGDGPDLFTDLPTLVSRFGAVGWDLVEMVLASQDDWDRYVAAQWLTTRRWLDANPDDELAGEMREDLRTAPLAHVTWQREGLGWGVFALMRR